MNSMQVLFDPSGHTITKISKLPFIKYNKFCINRQCMKKANVGSGKPTQYTFEKCHDLVQLTYTPYRIKV